MSFDYGMRAAILSFGFFFLLHFVLAYAVSNAAKLRGFDLMSPRVAARLLLALRLLPVLCALGLSFGVLTPAYFQWERQKGSEPVNVVLIFAAIAGVSIWIQSLTRSARALYFSLTTSQVPLIESSVPFLALAGFVRPRIIVSRGFLEKVSSERREVAMQHEMAHFHAADNLKRLAMLLAPPALPSWNSKGIGSCVFDPLEQAWARYAERAADDHAVAGEAERATLLAEVLVQVARGNCEHPPALALASTLVGSPGELHRRVERLLAPSVNANMQVTDKMSSAIAAAVLLTPLLLVLGLIAMDASRPLFYFVERLLLHH